MVILDSIQAYVGTNFNMNNANEVRNVMAKLKAENQMLWVQRMNNIHNRATEIVNADLIYE